MGVIIIVNKIIKNETQIRLLPYREHGSLLTTKNKPILMSHRPLVEHIIKAGKTSKHLVLTTSRLKKLWQT